MPDYDFQKYKPLIRGYVRALRPSCDSGGNFQCLNPSHADGTDPSQWSMGWGKQPHTLHCYGCKTGGHDWDIYDLVGALEGITEKGAQYRRVAEMVGDTPDDPRWVCPPSAPPDPDFMPGGEAIEEVYQWLREIRPTYQSQIDAFAAFRGHPVEWGNRLAWWPGLAVARGALPESVLVSAGMIDPAKSPDKAAFNADGAIVRLGRGFKLHYAGRPDTDGHVPTVKRGSRGCHTFPYPALPEGDTVVLVEGELDAVSGRYAGIPAVSIGGTNGLTAEDVGFLSAVGDRRVILALDNDEAGRKATHRIASMFRSCLSVDWDHPDWRSETDGEKDIDDMVKHGKAGIVLKMIENAKEVEDGENDAVHHERGEKNAGQGVSVNDKGNAAGSAGTANHGNDQRHESPDRGDEGNEEGGVDVDDGGNPALRNGRGRARVEGQGESNGQTCAASNIQCTAHESDNKREIPGTAVPSRLVSGGTNGGSVNVANHDDSTTMGSGSVRVGTGNGARETGSHRGNTGSGSNAQTARPVPADTDAPDLHDEDGRITPQDIPFQFLGFDEGAYYFMPKFQNVAKRVGCSETAMKQMVFDLAPESWWLTYFGRTSEKGTEYVDMTSAIEWLRVGSTRKGMFNNEKLLGTGVYKDVGGAVVNTGVALVTPDGSVSRFSEYAGKLTFVRSPVELVVDGTPWTVEDGRRFYKQLKTFGFDQPLAYYAVAGWCALAPFASFLFRRPHIWITARRGMGKTFLIDNLISPILGEDYVFYTDGSTEAGIRQSLYRDNRPVILDEFEANKKYDIDSLERILELSRSAYGGKKKVKGSSSQKAISFTLKVMFCFSSINVNISNDADRSRIAVCRMTESKGRMGIIDNPDGLRARIFHRLNEINPNILAVHHLMERMEYEDRTADTYATLLAGMWMLLSDARFPHNEEELTALSDDDRRLYDHLIASLPQTAQTEEKRPDEERILEEVFQTRLRLESGSEKTVAEMLTTLDDVKRLVYDDNIQRFGLKRGKDRDGTEFLAVVHDSKEVKGMLKETPFASSYKEVLKRNFAYIGTKQIHVAKQQMSCILLRWSDIEAKYFKEETDIVPF